MCKRFLVPSGFLVLETVRLIGLFDLDKAVRDYSGRNTTFFLYGSRDGRGNLKIQK